MQFARVAHATDFIYCYTILECNKRSDSMPSDTERRSIPTTPSTRAPIIDADSLSTELNTFFPFDPYRLPKSSVYIKDIYREWSAVAIGDDDDDASDLDDDDENSSRALVPNDRLKIPRSDNPGTDGLGESLGKMSISPVYPSPVPRTRDPVPVRLF
jgi:RNA polymerase I-specific transcription initiation factor RRN3